jgi:hypothetical protein
MRVWRPIKKLNAPKDYHWDDEEVLYEKNDSFLLGLMIGIIAGGWITGIIALIGNC